MNVFDDSNSVTLQVDDAVLDKSLTHRSFMTNREIVTKPLSSEQATDTRDAFAKVPTSSHHTVQMFFFPEEEKKTYWPSNIWTMDYIQSTFRLHKFPLLLHSLTGHVWEAVCLDVHKNKRRHSQTPDWWAVLHTQVHWSAWHFWLWEFPSEQVSICCLN